MYNFLQQIINGLTLGSIYALIAIGYTMVYGIIGLINFAHGEIYMIGAYIGVVSLVGLPTFGLPLTLVIILALLIAVVLTGATARAWCHSSPPSGCPSSCKILSLSDKATKTSPCNRC